MFPFSFVLSFLKGGCRSRDLIKVVRFTTTCAISEIGGKSDLFIAHFQFLTRGYLFWMRGYDQG
jgi:hypothetical protein